MPAQGMKINKRVRYMNLGPLIPRKAGWVLIILLLIPALSAVAQQATEQQKQLFNQAVQHFNTNRYAAAAEAFALAERAGLNTPRLHINYGVTLFRLGRNGDAIDRFERVPAGSPDYPRAQYNIGLAYRAQKKYGDAARAFAEAGRTAQDKRIRKLAMAGLEDAKQKQLRALATSPFVVARRVDPVRGAFVVSGGFDDNATLSAEASQIGVSNSEDFFLEGVGNAQFQLQGNRANGARLALTGVVKRYEEVDEFNQAAGQVQFKLDRQFGLWTGTAGVEGETIFLDDERFTSAGSLILEARGPITRRIGAALGYTGSYIDAGSEFSSLDGHRHTLDASLLALSPIGLTELGYIFEVNDRDDLDGGESLFVSRSPTYHTFFLKHRSKLTDKFILEPKVSYRSARYADDDRRPVLEDGNLLDGLLGEVGNVGDTLGGLGGLLGDLGGLGLGLDNLGLGGLDVGDLGLGGPLIGVENRRREDDRFQAALRAEYKLPKSLFLLARYEYTDNNSNFDQFDYDRNVISMGLGGRF